MFETFLEVVQKYFKNYDVTQPLDIDQDLQSYGIDSLNEIKLLAALEEKFQFEIADEYLVQETFDSIRSLYEAVHHSLALKTEPSGAIIGFRSDSIDSSVAMENVIRIQ